MNNSINSKCLFETSALQIAPADQPFWYTSGLIGPFYINTHFVCGGTDTAKEILDFIDTNSKNIAEFPELILSKLKDVYDSHQIYRDICDSIALSIKDIIKSNNISYISGGERRDWFFAPLIAKLLDLPCLYIYKDSNVYDSKGHSVKDLENQNVLNIADLLTAGSSYTSLWQPALEKINAKLIASANVVDRLQGGISNLNEVGIQHVFNLFKIDQGFFDEALEMKYIDANQYQILKNYLNDPQKTMQDWLTSNPDFLKEALDSEDAKLKQRANKLIANKLYHI